MKKTSKPTAGSRQRSRARKPVSRSKPAPRLSDALVAFADLARRERVRWYVFGAQAVAVYGVPRTTDDVDVTIDLGDRDIASFVPALRRAGFSPAIADEAFARETRVFPVIHDASGWSIDIVLAGPGLEHEFLDAARTIEIAGHAVPVIAPEHLIALKVLAGRPKDLEDVRGLIRIAELDHGRVEETLALLEEALDQSDLRPVYDRLRAEARR